MSGSRPSSVARLMPTAFCTTMKDATQTKKTTKAIPPSLSFIKLALKPIEAKNTSIKLVCNSLLKTMLYPHMVWTSSEITAATKPPATGSGIL
ncbi:hypothetical protein D9M71_523860 [compost metagenome]